MPTAAKYIMMGKTMKTRLTVPPSIALVVNSQSVNTEILRNVMLRRVLSLINAFVIPSRVNSIIPCV